MRINYCIGECIKCCATCTLYNCAIEQGMAQSPRREITVKLRRAGWEVEITCSESQLKQAIDGVLSSLNVAGSPSPASSPLEEKLGNQQGSKTCRGLIVDLWKESWFGQGRSLGQVHEEIARRGYHYD